MLLHYQDKAKAPNTYGHGQLARKPCKAAAQVRLPLPSLLLYLPMALHACYTAAFTKQDQFGGRQEPGMLMVQAEGKGKVLEN
mmetsp:Transcript_30493/g.55885  ORF Transcript_30493/g.55885 Transcript_30493/m.55885 type:complete len:83 (-) Transcript_30493:232-480(-)